MKKIALTFDDGPNYPHTDHLLGVLSSYQVKATFFMLGQFVMERPDIACGVRDEGHQVGNHTLSHPDLTKLNRAEIITEIGNCHDILNRTLGSYSGLFRPPFMQTNNEIEEVAAKFGLRTVKYHAAGGDGSKKTRGEICDKIVREIKGDSAIILLHDGYHGAMGGERASTVDAVDWLINFYKGYGFEFCFPQELM